MSFEFETVHPIARLPDEWRRALVRLEEKPSRAMRIFQAIHRSGILDPGAIPELSDALRARLAADGLGRVLNVETIRRSTDGTRKLVVSFADAATVESVLIPTANKQARWVTQCISTQVGCAMGCVFCASGVAGFKRQLGAEEIVAQVLEGRALLAPGEVLRNLVFMGMGEPLHNYAATARALRVLTCTDGIGLPARRITVSTSGLVPEIDRLGADFAGQITLAISLHATTDERRSALMPINKKYPIAELMAAVRRYPLRANRWITIEYTLVRGENDDMAECDRLIELVRGIPVKINLIPMNPISGSSLGPPANDRVLEFQKRLRDKGHSCFIRRQRGDDVDAACGQLALLGANPRSTKRRLGAVST